VAREAIRLLELQAPFFKLRQIRNAQMSVAAAAAGVEIFFRQHRLRPMSNVAMSIRRRRGASLAAMTNRATVGCRIVDNIRVTAINPIAFDAGLARRHADMAADAAVRRTHFAADDLAQLDRKRNRLRRRKLLLNATLNDAPVAQEIFIDGGPNQHCQRCDARPQEQMFVLLHQRNSNTGVV
jgi:hypothetical protein